MRFPCKYFPRKTPEYLTLSVGKSLLRLDFNFTSPSNCFLLGSKITSSVFLTLSQILFALNQIPDFLSQN